MNYDADRSCGLRIDGIMKSRLFMESSFEIKTAQYSRDVETENLY